MPHRLHQSTITELLASPQQHHDNKHVLNTDVLIAGTGPVGATYARVILESNPNVRVIMVDIGSQDSPVIGVHHKNSIKYQKDIDRFVNIINGALQPISVPPEDTFIPTLGGDGWRPPTGGIQKLVFQGNNPDQKPELNLKASAVTRAVGGMGTHWTCACPTPHAQERKENPIAQAELDSLLEEAKKLLNVHEHEYDISIRQKVVQLALKELGDRVKHLPLAVERRKDNPHYVTWSGPNTVLGNVVKSPNFKLLDEHQVIQVVSPVESTGEVTGVLLRNLKDDEDRLVIAKAVVLCCGAIPTPQILYKSGINPPALGHYLCEQSIAFCQIILREEYIKAIPTKEPFGEFEPFKDAIIKHIEKHKLDPLPIPFADPEPQLTLLYSPEYPWHVQIHRDAFSYGEVGPRADSRVVVDLRWFGKQDVKFENCVAFSGLKPNRSTGLLEPEITDIYGMPQPTFHVQRSVEDSKRDQTMMGDMTRVANILGSYLPGSYPQFMDAGLALHITGTIRIGTNPKTSVADEHSRVHGFKNLWVGGNGCIPDSTACNPTRTSVAIAIKGAHAVLKYLSSRKPGPGGI